MIRISALWAATMLAFAPPAQAGPVPPRPLVVAHSIDLSGPNGSIGRDYVAGITTGFDSINLKGGINGRKVSYIVRDDHGVPAEAAANVSALIKDEHADYLLGPLGSDATNAVVAAPAFAQSRHVLFAPLAGSSATPGARAMFWRPDIESEYLYLLTYFGNLGIKQVGIALQDTPQNAAAFKYLSREIAKRGMTLSGVASISASPALIHQQAIELSSAKPQLVIAIADTIGLAQFLRAFRSLAPSTYVAGTSLTNLSTLREIAGAKATDWTVFSQVVPDPARPVSALQAEHLKMMKLLRDEPVSALTLEGFAVAKTLVKLMSASASAPGVRLEGNKAKLDVGGMTISPPEHGYNLSRYISIALLRRQGGLLF